MILSEKLNFLYLKVSKTAGTTMEKCLGEDYGNTSIQFFSRDLLKAYYGPHVGPPLLPLTLSWEKQAALLRASRWELMEPAKRWIVKFGRLGEEVAGHTSIKMIERHSLISEKLFDKLFKFCFVRNPWDRMVSVYHFLKTHASDDDEELKCLTFKKFIKEIPAKIGRVGKDKFFTDFDEFTSLVMYIPQVDYVFNSEEEKVVDFVGRYENIKNDFTHIYKKIYDTNPGNMMDTKYNTTKHKHYSSYYTKKLKNIIGETYKEDIEKFGYSFEGT